MTYEAKGLGGKSGPNGLGGHLEIGLRLLSLGGKGLKTCSLVQNLILYQNIPVSWLSLVAVRKHLQKADAKISLTPQPDLRS
jgi:hypothetical protein